MKRLIVGSTLLLMLSAAADVSRADAILVSYTVSGSPGDYDLDFRVTNNMIAWHQNVYLFGVSLNGFDVVGSPPSFFSLGATSLNFAFYGGSDATYNTNWQVVDFNQSRLLPGDILSGFIAHDTDLIAPTAVSWFAFSETEVGFDTEPYTGGDSYNSAFSTTNPAFEGTANPSAAVPEPCSLALLGTGLLGLIAKRYRGRKSMRPVEARTTTSQVGFEDATHHSAWEVACPSGTWL